MEPTIIDRGRGPEIVGTRITVYDIMDYVRLGWHHSTMALWLGLSSRQVQAALHYIDAHREEVEKEYQLMLARDAQGNSPELQARLDGSAARLKAMIAERQALAAQEANGASHSARQQ